MTENKPNGPDTYTHGHAASVLRSHTWRTLDNSAAYLAAHLNSHDRLLDIGCGPGTISADFARRVADVVALDISDDVVAKAAAHIESLGLNNVEVSVGDTYALDYADNTFDITHAHQMLQHLTRPVDALSEMIRVTKPGGLVAVRDADYSAMFWAPQPELLDRWLEMYLAVARRNDAEPDAGRWLNSWAKAAGSSQVEVTSSVWVFTADDERSWWGELWADRVLDSSLAAQAVDYGIASRAELEAISAAWRDWIGAPDAFFAVPNVELLITV
jgi:ubiquinone/menaquinone biosynthesis C-methylase UbiE